MPDFLEEMLQQDRTIAMMHEEWDINSPGLWKDPKKPEEDEEKLSALDLVPETERERLILLQACDGDPVVARELEEEWDWVEVNRFRMLKLASIWRPRT